jgi:hypothetical protein
MEEVAHAADELRRGRDAGGTVEFVGDWARLLPCADLHHDRHPRVDTDRMGEWAHGLSVAAWPTDARCRRRGDGVVQRLARRRDDACAATAPTTSSALIDAEEAGDRLSADELVALCAAHSPDT